MACHGMSWHVMACHGSQSAFQRSRRRLLAGATNHPVAGATNLWNCWEPQTYLDRTPLPSGKHTKNHGKIHHFLWVNPLQMAMFNGYDSLPEGRWARWMYSPKNKCLWEPLFLGEFHLSKGTRNLTQKVSEIWFCRGFPLVCFEPVCLLVSARSSKICHISA